MTIDFISQKKLIFIFCVIFTFSNLLNGQNPGYFIFDTSNGLLSDEVYDVEIANDGLIWITTDRGVQSYDGFEFTNYSMVDGLQDIVNFEIFEDDKGVLWFNGYNGKISYYSEGKFYGYERNDEVLSYLKNPSLGWISNMVVSDSSILMAGEGSNEPKLFRIDKSGNQVISDFEQTKVGGKDFKYIQYNDFIFSFHILSDYNHSFLYNKVSQKKHNRSLLISNTSLLINFGETFKVINFDSDVGFVNNEEENVIWVCTPTGLYSIDLRDNFKVSRFFEDFYSTSIKRDLEGNYWISTMESGLLLVPSFKFTNLKITNDDTKNEKFLSLGLLRDYLITGTSRASIYSIDSNHLINVIASHKKGGQQIEKFFNIGENRLNSSLGILSIVNGKIEKEQPSRYLNNQVYKNNFDLEIFSKGLVIRDKEYNKIASSKNFNTPITSKVRTFYVEDDFFLTGAQSGLYLTIDTNFRDTKEIYFEGNSIGRVSEIVTDKNGNIVVLTMNNGIYFYKDEQLVKLEGSFDKSSVNDGVFKDNILWIGTNQGLYKYELRYSSDIPEIIDLMKYNISDGIPSNYINDLYFQNDELWLATNKGICYFKPEKQDFQPGKVPLFIKYVMANDSINLVENAELAYDQNDISIGYRGLSMKKEGIDPFYKFRLIKDSKETDWRNTNLNEMQFEDLEPGHYKFEVKAKNYVGEWNEDPITFNFSIVPHFTDRIWFKILSFLLVLGGVISYFLWVLSRNRKRFRLRERLKQTELDARESELSLLRNQMNPHFIFNSLNSIQNLIFKKDDKRANQYLTTFGSLIRKTLEYTREKKITLREEIDFTKKYLELEMMRFPKKFEYNITDLELVEADKLKVPPLLLQPIVENSIVHGFKGLDYKGKISIKIVDNNQESFQIVISDNGRGLIENKTKKNHKSIGTTLIKERLNLINQSLNSDLAGVEIHSKNGTEVILSLPKGL